MECDTDSPVPVENSEMLDLKPEREPEPKKNTPQVPVVPQPAVPEPPTENAPEVPEAPSAGKFGWTSPEETIKSLPFVTRDSECFIAKEICQSEILKMYHLYPNAITDSDEYMKVFKMTSSEAITFNEVNIEHCDKGLVGNYSFKPGDILFNLNDVKAYIKFLIAFKNAVKYKDKQNDLFGFVKINTENHIVPFVWSEGKQLMPTFYFDGADEFLKEKFIRITDKWMCLYLRICFILQKVRTEHYHTKSIEVVDVKDIEHLFSPDTVYTLSWPGDGYKEENFVSLMEVNDQSPEAMLAAMHGMTGPPQSPTINQNRKEKRTEVIPRKDTIPAPTQPSNMYNPSNFLSVPQQPSASYEMPRNNLPTRSPQFVCTDPNCTACFSKPNVVTKTYYPPNIPTTTNQIPANDNSQVTNTKPNRQKRKSNKNLNNIPFKKPRELLPAEVPQTMPASSSTNRLSNVPYASPQSASSPELQFPSPIISGASVASMRNDLQSPTYTYETMGGSPSYTNVPVSRDQQPPSYTNVPVRRDQQPPSYTNGPVRRDQQPPSYTNVPVRRDQQPPSYTNVPVRRDQQPPSYTNVPVRRDQQPPSYSNDYVRRQPPFLSNTNEPLRRDPRSLSNTNEPVRRDPRSLSNTNEAVGRDPRYSIENEISGYLNRSGERITNDIQALQMQRRSRLANFYSYHQLSLQQQANNNNNRMVASANTSLAPSVIVTAAGYYSAGYNNGTVVASTNMQVSQNNTVNSAGYYSAGYNNATVVSSNTHIPQNLLLTPAGYNNGTMTFENGPLTQSVILNSAGYYMPLNNPAYLPGSVTSSRTNGVSGGIEKLL